MAAVLSWQACLLRENFVEQFHSKSVPALIIAFLTVHKQICVWVYGWCYLQIYLHGWKLQSFQLLFFYVLVPLTTPLLCLLLRSEKTSSMLCCYCNIDPWSPFTPRLAFSLLATSGHDINHLLSIICGQISTQLLLTQTFKLLYPFHPLPRTQARTFTLIHTPTLAHKRTPIIAVIHTHTRKHPIAHKCTNTHTQAHPYTQSYAHPNTLIHTVIHTHNRAQIHKHMHTHPCTHIHTVIHTHTYKKLKHNQEAFSEKNHLLKKFSDLCRTR